MLNTFGLTGKETFKLKLMKHVKPRDIVKVTATDEARKEKEFEVLFVSIVKLKSTTTVMVESFKWYFVNKLEQLA